MFEDHTFNYNDINLDFLELTPPSQSKVVSQPERNLTPIACPQLPPKQLHLHHDQRVAKKRTDLAQRIAHTDTLVQKVRQLEKECSQLRQQLIDFQQTASEIEELYTKEKQAHGALKVAMEQLQEKCEKLDVELAHKTLQHDQLYAQWEEQKAHPLDFDELALKYVKLAYKLEEEKVPLHWQEQSNLEEMKRYCMSRKLRLPPARSPKKRVRTSKSEKAVQCEIEEETPIKALTVCKSEKAIQCELQDESSTSFVSASKSEKAIQCEPEEEALVGPLKRTQTQETQCTVETSSQSTQCTVEMRTQDTQHISTTTTRGTSTACFIKQRHVGTSFPEPKPFDDILQELLDWDCIKPVSPINDPPASNSMAAATVVTMKTTGTCTWLCNIRRPIDFVNITNLKRFTSRPPSSLLCEGIKHETFTPSPTPPLADSHTRPPANLVPPLSSIPESASSNFFQFSTLGNLSASAFDELWQIFGKMLLGLLSYRNAGVATPINGSVPTSNECTNQQEFYNWLRTLYTQEQQQNNFEDTTTDITNILRPQARRDYYTNTSQETSVQTQTDTTEKQEIFHSKMSDQQNVAATSPMDLSNTCTSAISGNIKGSGSLATIGELGNSLLPGNHKPQASAFKPHSKLAQTQESSGVVDKMIVSINSQICEGKAVAAKRIFKRRRKKYKRHERKGSGKRTEKPQTHRKEVMETAVEFLASLNNFLCPNNESTVTLETKNSETATIADENSHPIVEEKLPQSADESSKVESKNDFVFIKPHNVKKMKLKTQSHSELEHELFGDCGTDSDEEEYGKGVTLEKEENSRSEDKLRDNTSDTECSKTLQSVQPINNNRTKVDNWKEVLAEENATEDGQLQKTNTSSNLSENNCYDLLISRINKKFIELEDKHQITSNDRANFLFENEKEQLSQKTDTINNDDSHQNTFSGNLKQDLNKPENVSLSTIESATSIITITDTSTGNTSKDIDNSVLDGSSVTEISSDRSFLHENNSNHSTSCKGNLVIDENWENEPPNKTYTSSGDETNNTSLSPILDSKILNDLITRSTSADTDSSENMSSPHQPEEVQQKRVRKRKSETVVDSQPCKRSERLRAQRAMIEQSSNLISPINSGKCRASQQVPKRLKDIRKKSLMKELPIIDESTTESEYPSPQFGYFQEREPFRTASVEANSDADDKFGRLIKNETEVERYNKPITETIPTEETTSINRDLNDSRHLDAQPLQPSYESPLSPSSGEMIDEHTVHLPTIIPLNSPVGPRNCSLSLLDRLIVCYSADENKRITSTVRDKNWLNTERQLQKHLRLYLESEIPMDADVMASQLIENLFKITTNDEQIVAAIVKEMQEVPQILTVDMPSVIQEIPPAHLSSAHQRMAVVLRHLCSTCSDFGNKLTTKVETVLFNYTQVDKLSVEAALNLTQLYLLTVALGGDQTSKHPARLFVAKCIYFHQLKAIPMIHEVLCWHPTTLPHREDRTYDRSDPLITVIQHILMTTKYDMDKEDLRTKLLLSKLRFEYHFEPFSPNINDVLANLMEKLKAGKLTHISYAYAILCKRMSPTKVTAIVLEEQLIPLATVYYTLALENDLYDSRIAALLECISMIVKPFPLDTDVSVYLALFSRFLNAVDRPCVQEAAVCAILRFQRFSYVACFNALFHYRPTYNLQPITKAILKTFIHRRPLKVWKTLRSQASLAID